MSRTPSAIKSRSADGNRVAKETRSVSIRRFDAAENAASDPSAAQENCPVIRANKILFAGSPSGRTRIVFF